MLSGFRLLTWSSSSPPPQLNSISLESLIWCNAYSSPFVPKVLESALLPYWAIRSLVLLPSIGLCPSPHLPLQPYLIFVSGWLYISVALLPSSFSSYKLMVSYFEVPCVWLDIPSILFFCASLQAVMFNFGFHFESWSSQSLCLLYLYPYP